MNPMLSFHDVLAHPALAAAGGGLATYTAAESAGLPSPELLAGIAAIIAATATLIRELRLLRTKTQAKDKPE